MIKSKQTEKSVSEIPEIQLLLQKVRNFINKKYARYLKKDEDGNYPMCPDIEDYLSDVEAIINDLEIKLKEAYHI